MITITVDAALLATLRQADGPAEVRDADGNVVGIFAPVAPEHAEAAARTDWEELERRARSTGGRTLKEIFQRLQTLTADEAVRADLQRKIDQMTKDEECDTRSCTTSPPKTS